MVTVRLLKGVLSAMLLVVNLLTVGFSVSRLLAAPPSAVEKGRLETMLPQPSEFQGLRGVSPPAFYEPDNLWDYMDGQAEAYLAYGFELLVAAEYSAGEGLPITVEIYRMKGPEYAFGIHAAERTPDDEFVKVGVQGYWGNGVLGFWKGPYYVKIVSSGVSHGTREKIEMLAGILARKIEGDYSEPELFSAFPERGKVKMSERFIPKDFLAQPYLKNGYRVDYQKDGRDYQMFLLREVSVEEARKAFERYLGFLESQQGMIRHLNKTPYKAAIAEGETKTFIFQRGPFLGGTLNQEDFSEAQERITEMMERLKPFGGDGF